jgi:hypothetical protein
MNICDITMDRFDECRELLYSINPRMSDEQWKVVFESHWTDQAPGIGIEVDGVIGGIMMLITSTREIEGNLLKVCAPSTWVVAPEYRQYSLGLLQHLMATDFDVIVTHTLSDVAYRMFKIFKMVDFEDSKYWILPGFGIETFRPFENQLVRDHQFSGCVALAAMGYEVILKRICKIKKGVKLTFFELLYTNQLLDNKILKKLSLHLFLKHFSGGLLVDSRFTKGKIRGFKYDNKKLCRANLEHPENLDNLYSELAVMSRGYS